MEKARSGIGTKTQAMIATNRALAARFEEEAKAQAIKAKEVAEKRAIPVCLSEQPLSAPTVYVGMNGESATHEARVIKATTGASVYQYTASEESKQCTTVGAVIDALKLTSDNQALLLTGISPRTAAPAMALARRMAATEDGGAPMTRLILSGHGEELYGNEPDRRLPEWTRTALSKVFPKAAAGVKSMMLSGCYTGYESSMAMHRDQFPNLEQVVAYDGTSPSATADRDLRYFLRATDSGQEVKRTQVPSSESPTMFPTTWSKQRSFDSGSPQTFAGVMEQVRAAEPIWQGYVSGKTPRRQGPKDAELRRYYVLLKQAVHMKDAPAEAVTKLRELIAKVLDARMGR